MKITGQHPQKPSELSNGKAREAENNQPRKGGHVEENAAQVRHQTTLVTHKLREAVRSEPEVRADRVAEVKAKLASGDFKVDAEKLAGNILIESLREDLDKS